MNWNRIKVGWKQVKARAKQKWLELAGDAPDDLDSNWRRRAGRLQISYARAEDGARRQIREFGKSASL